MELRCHEDHLVLLCRGMTTAATTERLCRFCGEALVQKDPEQRADFPRRKYCDRNCSVASRGLGDELRQVRRLSKPAGFPRVDSANRCGHRRPARDYLYIDWPAGERATVAGRLSGGSALLPS